VLIYLLIVVNFQSWLDPFVIVMALPTALAGIVWILFTTDTTLSVPALTGAIMCMGVATANSILIISFARERLAAGADALTAALDAGSSRFRPVLMTALAMIIGMAPMAIEPGQNAPLGRAVIGGLLFATCATLFLVPTMFSVVHARDQNAPTRFLHPHIQPRPSAYVLATRQAAEASSPDPGCVDCPRCCCRTRCKWPDQRSRSKQDLMQWSAAQAPPTVALAKLARGDAEQRLILPGDIQPTTRRQSMRGSAVISSPGAGYRGEGDGRSAAGLDRSPRSRPTARSGQSNAGKRQG